MERGIITITENGLVAIPTAPVWMTQQEMSDAFNVFGCDIRKAIHSIYKNMELLESETKRYRAWLSGGSSWGNYMPPIGKNRYICSFRQRHIYEKPQVVDTKDIRPDKVRNTT